MALGAEIYGIAELHCQRTGLPHHQMYEALAYALTGWAVVVLASYCAERPLPETAFDTLVTDVHLRLLRQARHLADQSGETLLSQRLYDLAGRDSTVVGGHA
jgi:hypothetical protein